MFVHLENGGEAEAFQTLPRFEDGCAGLTLDQQAMFRRGVSEAFEPELCCPTIPFALPYGLENWPVIPACSR